MAKKKITSGEIKNYLSRHPEAGGNAKDWKRTSRNKLPEGIRREFQNSATGQIAVVMENKDGSLSVESKENPDKSLLQGKITMAQENAAKEYVTLVLMNENEFDDYCEEKNLDDNLDMYDYLEDLVKKAGQALAGQFHFAYDTENPNSEDNAFVFDSIVNFKDGYSVPEKEYDLYKLIPVGVDFDCERNRCFFLEDTLSPFERAKTLLDAGFVWDKDFQNKTETEEEFTKQMSAELLKREQKTKPSTKKGPEPK